ncbi:MAG: YoaK family protein [Pseudomonadota bacterium]
MIDLLAPDARSERRLAIGLALIAGYVDAYSLISYGLYVSFMSGNTTQSGSSLGHGMPAAALPAVLAIVAFLFGSFAGTWIARSKLPHARQALFGAIAAVLAVIIFGTALDNNAWPALLGIPLLAAAMGVMNATHSHVGAEPMSITFVTGTLHKTGTHLALALRHESVPDAQGPWDTHLRRAGVVASVWLGFFCGTIVSAFASLRFGEWALLLPLSALLALILPRRR